MKTSHRMDGPGAFVRPGPGPAQGEFSATPANDNRVPRGGSLPYARGVVMQMTQDDEGAPLVTLHLLMLDGAIGVPFHRAAHDFDVIAMWRGLGRDFNLPLFLCSEDGILSALAPDFGETSHPRRVGSPLAARRPRFLARRRMPLAPHGLAQAPRVQDVV